MASQEDLSKEDFLRMGEAAGLDISDTAHMDELFPYVRAALRSFRSLDELDLSAVEPEMVYQPDRE